MNWIILLTIKRAHQWAHRMPNSAPPIRLRRSTSRNSITWNRYASRSPHRWPLTPDVVGPDAIGEPGDVP